MRISVVLSLFILMCVCSPVARAAGENTGADLFRQHCAVCHGTDAKGRGPAATALKHTPADLTKLARRNGGTFPELAVMQKIRGQNADEMPEWGKMLTERRVVAIVEYLTQVQVK